MKFLMAVSAIDLAEKPAATLSWWSLFRALNELGQEVVVMPFLGKSVQSPWWKPWNNPSKKLSSFMYSEGRSLSGSPRIRSFYQSHYDTILAIPRLIISRNWRTSIEKFLESEGKVDAIIFFSVPLNLISDVPSFVEKKWAIPSIYYEADMPEVLPTYGGFHFTYYLGVNLSQFRGFLSNSSGVQKIVEAMGARNVRALHWGVDSKIFSPVESEKDTDVFFSGGSNKFRQDWVKRMVASPALELPEKIFAVSGRSKEEFSGVKRLGFLPFGDWKRQISGSNICLNISRSPHATVGGTSTMRVFELASMASCIVSNPHKGIEEWFEPGKEIIVLKEDDRPAEVYDWLLGSKGVREEVGAQARERVLAEHTYDHRAKELLNYVEMAI
jgi:Glycosyl transferases group 1